MRQLVVVSCVSEWSVQYRANFDGKRNKSLHDRLYSLYLADSVQTLRRWSL